MNFDFVAIKTGDVNGDYDSYTSTSRSFNDYEIVTRISQSSNLITMDFYASETRNILGFQFSLPIRDLNSEVTTVASEVDSFYVQQPANPAYAGEI